MHAGAPRYGPCSGVLPTSALDEVLSNAYKFTHEGVVRVATETDGPTAVVTVDDTGIGMAADYRARLFTPLVQEDQRLNREYNGAGLGLALAQRLVVALGGSIEVDSEKGRGTTVRIRLPHEREGPLSHLWQRALSRAGAGRSRRHGATRERPVRGPSGAATRTAARSAAPGPVRCDGGTNVTEK